MMGSELKASFGSSDSSQYDQYHILHANLIRLTNSAVASGGPQRAAPPPLNLMAPRPAGAARRGAARRVNTL